MSKLGSKIEIGKIQEVLGGFVVVAVVWRGFKKKTNWKALGGISAGSSKVLSGTHSKLWNPRQTSKENHWSRIY